MPTNILLIMADQLPADALACNGNPVIDTPNLDRLARTGVNCTACYTPAPICVPARAALATGCYPHRCTGTKNNEGTILHGLPLLPAELAAAGYRTYATGKLHYLPYRPPGEPRVTHGFQVSEVAESGRALRKWDPEGRLRGLEDYLDYLHEVGWGGYSRANGLGNNDVFASASAMPARALRGCLGGHPGHPPPGPASARTPRPAVLPVRLLSQAAHRLRSAAAVRRALRPAADARSGRQRRSAGRARPDGVRQPPGGVRVERILSGGDAHHQGALLRTGDLPGPAGRPAAGLPGGARTARGHAGGVHRRPRRDAGRLRPVPQGELL